MITASQVSITTTPTLLVSANGKTNVQLSADLFSGATVVYLRQGSGVTTNNSFPWQGSVGGRNFETDLESGDEIYAIVASGSQTVGILLKQ